MSENSLSKFIPSINKTLKAHLLSDRLEARLYLSDKSRKIQTPSYHQKNRVLAQKAFLGNTTKTVNPVTAENPKDKYNSRFTFLNASRKINHDKRVKNCCRSVLSGSDSVTIKQSANGFSYGNIQRCGSVWICPVCASHIVTNRRLELGDFIERVYKQNHHVSMLTLTISHGTNDFLRNTLANISKAFKLMQNRKPWKQFKADYGITGTIRTLEVTNGDHGWHPHFHVLLISEKSITPLQTASVLKFWSAACDTVGVYCNEHGANIKNCTVSIADYVQKWGIDFEMTSGNQSKIALKSGLNPFQILQQAHDGDEHAARLFREYSVCFTGKRQLVYSEGLRSLYGCNEAKTDEELLKDEQQKADNIAIVSLEGWKLILKYDIRGDLLDSLQYDSDFNLVFSAYGLSSYVTMLL